MSKRVKGLIAGGVAAGMMIGSGIIAAPANAEINRSAQGTCTSGAIWDLDVERDDGMLEIDWDVDRARPVERFRVVVKVNNQRVWRANVRTDRDGDVWFTRMVRDRQGPDTVSVRMVSPRGDVCRGSVRI